MAPYAISKTVSKEKEGKEGTNVERKVLKTKRTLDTGPGRLTQGGSDLKFSSLIMVPEKYRASF